VKIRPALPADIPGILNLERQSATAGHWTEAQYRRAFQPGGPPRLALVVDGGSPSSAGTGAHSPAIMAFLIAQHLAPEWELENLVVAANVRRKGLGKRLLRALLDAARKTNSTSVFLEARESNFAARTLYEQAGFEQSGRRPFYYTNPSEDAILYRQTLP
jgi:ribosomal-protein-alanine N-acetyltransferase